MARNLTGRIKIVYILPTLAKGGAERFLIDLILSLDRQIFDPHLILFKGGGDWLVEIKAGNIPVVILEKKYKFDPINFWNLFLAIKKIGPQIVHTELGGDIYGRLAAKLVAVPIILSTEQNVNPDEGPVQNILKKLTNHLADKIVAISRAVKADLSERYKVRSDRITVIPNGLNTGKFLSRSKPVVNFEEARKSSLVFGTIGRLSPQKGHSLLIAAWGRLRQQDIKCLIAGAGPLEARLSEQIKEAKLEGSIKLIGLVADPAEFLRTLDVFVFPSLWEGQGVVLLEAGLVGLPIIASAVDGVKELIGEETGWLVPAGNEAALAEKIDWLAENLASPSVAEKIQKLKALIPASYDIKIISARYQDLYQSLLTDKFSHENITS